MSSALFDGILLIDKPKGCTSHDVVARVKRAINLKKVGHAGTLDPLATGLMVVLVGKATRLSDYILDGAKSYQVKATLGVETDTLDADGVEVSRWTGELPSLEKVRECVNTTSGELELKIPDYSAAKVDGKKLYEYARKGEAVPQIQKKMIFEKVEWIDGSETSFTAQIRCSKGSFIRSWAQEVGRRLGVGAHVSELRRIESSPFKVVNAVSLEVVEQSKSLVGLSPSTAIRIENSMNHCPAIGLNKFEERLMLSGQIPESIIDRIKDISSSEIRIISLEERLLAIVEKTDDHRLKIGCVFN